MTHLPVLLSEAEAGLNIRPGARAIDGTFGAGGHAEAILRASAPDGRLLGIDQDEAAVRLGRERLAGFAAVQNTYLSAFQSLGALGLLLGTFGLAAVQLRNVLERRRELALLRAAGFRRAALGWMVLVENALLLAAGLACGLLAAALAVLPHLLAGAAAAPIRSLAAMLLVILLVGLLASLLAVRATLRAPLVARHVD